MDQSAAIGRAKQFAQAAYVAELDNITREFQRKLGEMRSDLAARGLAMSGAMTSETARITGERINAMIQARLNVLLEGCELHGVLIDDQVAASLYGEVLNEMNEIIATSKAALPGGTPVMAGTESLYAQLVAQSVGISPAWIKTQIDHRRLAPRKNEPGPSTTIYHLQGDNARLNVNSTDHSVNVVTKSSQQIFVDLRQTLESSLPEGNERTAILEKLTALEAAKDSQSFARRYTDFIAAAANHVALLTPFIPALTEMLKGILS